MEETQTISEMVYPELKTTQRLDISSTHFHIWKQKLDFVFFDKHVSYVLTDPKPPEPPSTDTTVIDSSASAAASARYDKWVADDFTARHIILGAIADRMYLRYHDYPTAKSIMDGLTACFAPKNMDLRRYLLKRYVNHRMSESEDTPILEHIHKMATFATELELAGLPIHDELQAVMLVNSLPESWNDALGALTVFMDDDMSLANVSNRVRREGERQACYRARREEDKKKKKGNCKRCGNRGHYAHDCPYED